MPAAVKALLATGAAEPEVPHWRIWITRRQAGFIPQGAGGPVTPSLVTAARQNLAPAHRAEIVHILGPYHVALPETFGTGADVL